MADLGKWLLQSLNERFEWITSVGAWELLQDQRAWLVSLGLGAVTLVIYSVGNTLAKKAKYPDGPTPLPIFGNILAFRGKGHVHDKVIALGKKFGGIVTLWMGSDPAVNVYKLEPALEAFRDRKVEFAGRPYFNFTKSFLGEKGMDVVLADYGREWEVLRRVAYAALRKYAVSENLPPLVADVVDEVMALIKSEHGEKPFDGKDYFYLMTYNILAQSAYGKRYSIKDKEFIQLMDDNKTQLANTNKLLVVEFLPFMKIFYGKVFDQQTDIATRFREFLKGHYQDHLKSYEDGSIRDFCDALIAAKVEAEAEQKDSVQYLNDDNLGLTLLDLFSAGSDTTRNTFIWMVLFLANYPDVQKKLRQELEEVAGDQIVTQDHKARLNYMQAFLSESLRFRPVVPMGVPHKAVVDSFISGNPIKKGTTINLIQYAILHDPQHWDKPEEFRPERFLDESGRHNSKMSSFVAFGIGRRACPGEKLAITDMTFMLARVLQATRGHTIELPGGPGSVDLAGDDSVPQGLVSLDYEIVIRPSS